MCSFLLGLPIQETFSIVSLLVGEAEEFSFVGAREELGHLSRMLPPDGPERGSGPGPLWSDPDRILELQRVGPFRRCSDCGGLGLASRLLAEVKRRRLYAACSLLWRLCDRFRRIHVR